MSDNKLNSDIDLFLKKNDFLSSYTNLKKIENLEEFFSFVFCREGNMMLQVYGAEHYYDCHYNAIAVSMITNNGRLRGYPSVITQGFEKIGDIDKSFCITSPITYVGRNRTSKNSRVLFGFAIDLDGVDKIDRLLDLMHQTYKVDFLPDFNMISNSGHGLHVYYLLDKPIALANNKVKQILQKLKDGLTKIVWNPFTSCLKKKHLQSIFQGFRIPCTYSKFGKEYPVSGFIASNTDFTSIEELNKYIDGSKLTKEELEYLQKYGYEDEHLSLERAKELYPEWYERRIVRGERRGKWKIKRDLYDWFLKKIGNIDSNEVVVGHRYFCLLSLAMYAVKCGISYDELEKDAYGLMSHFDTLTVNDENHFLKEDVEDALKAYKESYSTFPRKDIEKLTGIRMDENKRNYRRQEVHLKVMRAMQSVLYPEGEWREGNGRKKGSIKKETPASIVVKKWVEAHPRSTKTECSRSTGLDYKTVLKWWPNKECSEDLIKRWRSDNKGGSKMQCSIDTGLAYNTVRKWWK